MPEKNKYYILSDLHLEFRQSDTKAFWSQLPEDPDVRVCIVAGDFTSFGLPDGMVWGQFQNLCKRFDRAIYVPGNHEYYGSSPAIVNHKLKILEGDMYPKLAVLRAGAVYIYNGQRFIGDTMWFPDRPEVHMYRSHMNDPVQIKDLFPWAFTQSGLFMGALHNLCQPNDIVVSHHVPTDVDTSPIWKLAPTQPYFVNSDSERFLMQVNTSKPKAWIYGHTHSKHHFLHAGVEFICNPLGYPSECGPDVTSAAGQVIYEI